MYNQAKTDAQNQRGFGYNGHGCGQSFKSRFAERFSRKSRFDKIFSEQFTNRKAANILESESSFIISLYAAGLNKNYFRISSREDILTISYTAPENQNEERLNFSHQEYEFGSFERSFQLNAKVLTDQISASYTDGVLNITLPKNPVTNTPPQEVQVD